MRPEVVPKKIPPRCVSQRKLYPAFSAASASSLFPKKA